MKWMTRRFGIAAHLALLQRLLLFGLAGLVLWCAMRVLTGVRPHLYTGGVGGPVLLCAALAGLSYLLIRSHEALGRRRAATDGGLQVGEYRHAVGERPGENRLLDFQARMSARVAEEEEAARLEREVGQRDRTIEKILHDGRIAELRQQNQLVGLKRELDYYKQEHLRLCQENRWLKSSLRQNHIDLAYLKEHVERHVRGARPTLLARVRSLFSLSCPSTSVVRLAREMEARARAAVALSSPAPAASGHGLAVAPPAPPAASDHAPWSRPILSVGPDSDDRG
jgi:hypothetical protein